jgi:hypothetical protein
LIQEVGGKIEVERGEQRIIFLIEKADGTSSASPESAAWDQDR